MPQNVAVLTLLQLCQSCSMRPQPVLVRCSQLACCPLQIGKLEEMWKLKPEAGVDDLDGPNDAEAEVQRVALRWAAAAAYPVLLHCRSG